MASSAALTVIGLHYHNRHLVQPGNPGGAPAAFAGDNLIVSGLQPANGQRLNDAVFLNGVGKIRQRCFVKLLAWLRGAAFHL
jgi:hypothetical protein